MTSIEHPMTHLPCPDCLDHPGQAPRAHFDDGPDVWTDECPGCWGSTVADELDCAVCGMCVSLIAGHDPEPHACDPENPLSYLCPICRADREWHDMSCVLSGRWRQCA